MCLLARRAAFPRRAALLSVCRLGLRATLLTQRCCPRPQNYLVLFLVPSVAECCVTLVLFFTHFKSPHLSAVALISFVMYTVLTVQITQWRKKFRTGQNKQDNKYHDIATDSLVNFETVKYFANEDLEIRQFKTAVKRFQSYNVGVQASLSLLNTSQQLDIQLTTLISLCLAATTILHHSRPGHVEIGDFVSVNAYVLQLFTPLSFLGTICEPPRPCSNSPALFPPL